MKRQRFAVALVLGMALTLGVMSTAAAKKHGATQPATKSAASAAGPGTITGELIDAKCYAKMGLRGADHRDCAAKCARGGFPVAVLDEQGGVTYLLMQASMLEPYMAKTVRVTGQAFPHSHAIAPTKLEVKEGGTWKQVKLPGKKM